MHHKDLPSPPPVTIRKELGLVEQVRSYQLITPLYGGGVETGTADPITVVRGTEIRGQLRFWWRATRGGAFGGDLSKMKAAEDEIWGTAAQKSEKKEAKKVGPSRVSLHVQIRNRGKQFQPVDKKGNALKDRQGRLLNDIGNPNSMDGYAAFPLRDSGKYVLEGVAFDLVIAFEATYHDDVEAALWAWETFGGIGARTRRGFGALQCTKVQSAGNTRTIQPPAGNKIQQVLQDELKHHVVEANQWPDGVPHLSRALRTNLAYTLPDDTPVDSWRYLIGELQAFRQMRSPNKFGKSDWPEPQSIRRIMRGQEGDKRFPRAQFGLPIIFEFMHKGEPPKTTLQGAEHDRLASPLILRPLACAGGKGMALAAILEGTKLPQEGVILKGAPGDPQVPTAVSPAAAKRIKPLKGETDVLQAFLNFLR